MAANKKIYVTDSFIMCVLWFCWEGEQPMGNFPWLEELVSHIVLFSVHEVKAAHLYLFLWL